MASYLSLIYAVITHFKIVGWYLYRAVKQVGNQSIYNYRKSSGDRPRRDVAVTFPLLGSRDQIPFRCPYPKYCFLTIANRYFIHRPLLYRKFRYKRGLARPFSLLVVNRPPKRRQLTNNMTVSFSSAFTDKIGLVFRTTLVKQIRT